MVKYLSFTRCVIVCLFLLFSQFNAAFTQSNKRLFKISGTVFDRSSKVKTTIPYATVSFNDYGINVSADVSGKFLIKAVPAGRTTLSVKYLGMVPLDTVINVNADLNLDLYLAVADFRLKEVSVTAKSGNDGNGTSSKISRTALDHLQANSLADVMSLLPGVVSVNPDLENAKILTLRSIGTAATNSNAFGTSILINGAPVSNNSNLQTLSPTVNGQAGALGGGASPGSGFDVRTISMDNVESVEVIRGVPGVQYGDLTAGAVIVNTKAGAQPLRVNAKTNPNVYQFGLTKGTELGGNNGALNLGLDYAHNTANPTAGNVTYERFTANVLYSNKFFNRLKSTISLDLIYGKDTRKPNSDDAANQISSSGRDLGFVFNTRGDLGFDKSWLRNLNYVARVGYTTKNTYFQNRYSSATAPYSMTYTDGAVLSNRPNTDIFDEQNNKLTNIGPADQNLYAVALPNSYVGRFGIDGKEFNTYLQTVATFFNKIGRTNNRWLLGADFKSDKNYGDGKSFSNTNPPARNNAIPNASFRPRVYNNIPAVNQLGLFAEEHFSNRFGSRNLQITAGLRYDNFSGNRNTLSPRINASLDIIPNVFSINGAYGKLAKAPATLYLHPEDAYFEYININETASSIPADQQVYMTTTRVFSTKNKDLEIAKNEKAELGFELNIKQTTLKVTAYSEKLTNGYSLGNSVNGYIPLVYNEYTRVNAAQPIYKLSQSNNVLAEINMPGNNQVAKTKGIEFELDLGRFETIRSAFSINGAWLRTETYNKDYFYFSDFSSVGGAGRTNIGLYEQGMAKRNDQRFVTALRSTHNIPEVGFVVTLTTQVVWNESDFTKFGNDSIPVKYISKNDGLVYDFDKSKKDDTEFKPLIRNINERVYIKESYRPALMFNVNLTKEIADYMRVSFFANNMFRDYQITESKRNPGTYLQRNNKLFFGLALSLTLK
ncbi:Outer membrane receptor for ferrienterochelin and colicins [Pedobacter sp. ok626]|uniref:TonB-dependent receptor n=1 Tax=Pedobacter sp. ok626 TaxID=1761882 RepID=UPI0008874792|nr:carboxypeptidase-like regulatory domain-containing protein [Pedobacter sp. ok626]SDK97200.1 Outer membrane receptor for ferrienterochelin and colicins [Pedobacter sp. ok626]